VFYHREIAERTHVNDIRCTDFLYAGHEANAQHAEIKCVRGKRKKIKQTIQFFSNTHYY